MAEDKAWQPLDLVKVSSDYLAGKSVPTPRLDAEVLLCGVLGLERRVDLYAGFERKISGKELAAYRELIRRRAAREPVSRILGQRDFMGLTFMVTPDVLSPRPETEILAEAVVALLRPARKKPSESDDVEAEAETPAEEELMPDALAQLLDKYAADVDSEDELDKDDVLRAAPKTRAPKADAGKKKRSARPEQPEGPAARILDLGTGSGCIAAGIAAQVYTARVVAVDASPKALAVAKKNAAKAGVAERIEFRQGDWFSACREGEVFDVIVSNPPYLVEGDPEIWPEVSAYDPPLSLYGGRDGLDCYRRIIPSAPDWLAPEGRVFFEVGAGQAGTIGEMLERRGFREVGTLKDYGGVARVVTAVAPEA